MKEPLVSILIPAHNAGRWLAAAVESSLGQTWRRKEIIIVDDGSADDTLEVARSLRDPSIQVIHTQQRGASAARNTAYQASSGEFIQYLDADDLLAPDKIELQMRANIGASTGLLTFGSVANFTDPRSPSTGVITTAAEGRDITDPLDFLIDLLGGNGRGWMVQTSQWLVPRPIAQGAGPWNESLMVDNDGEYFSRVILGAQRILRCPASLCYFRQHPRGGNLSFRGGTSAAGAASLLRSTRLKEKWLRAVSSDPRIDDAIANSLSSLALQSYPVSPEVSREAIHELQALGRKLKVRGGTKWFGAMRRIGGWKFARRVQHFVHSVRAKQ